MKHARGLVMAAAMMAGIGGVAQAASIDGTLPNVPAINVYPWAADAVLHGQSRIFSAVIWSGALGSASQCPTFRDCSTDLRSGMDLWFTYDGATNNNPASHQSVALGRFATQSIYDDELVGSWSAQDTTDPFAAAQVVGVPEAGTLVMLGLGLLGAGISARRRS